MILDGTLQTIARPLKNSDIIDYGSILPSECEIDEISAEMLLECNETIYLRNKGNKITGKVSKELVEYLSKTSDSHLLNSIMNHMDEGIVAIDQIGRIFYINEAYTRILGVKPYKVIGRNILQLEPDSVLSNVFKTHVAEKDEDKKIGSLGRRVSVDVRPIFKKNEFVGAVSIFKDVTDVHVLNTQVKNMQSIIEEYAQKFAADNLLDNAAMVTNSKAYRTVVEEGVVIARTDVPILIRGENGTGKEVLAKFLYQNSTRSDKPFITVNCAAIPETLLESELFGYEEGSFTGAVVGGKKGKFELADKGTIFLDEIGDMPVNMQAKLLRVLQFGEIDKIGGQRSIPVDVRIICATNQPLEEMIKEKKFREDLFFRINTFVLTIPPLRERLDDIVSLAKRFLDEYNEKYGKHVEFSQSDYQNMKQYDWPGNVRELRHEIEKTVILNGVSGGWKKGGVLLPEETLDLKNENINFFSGTLSQRVKLFEKTQITAVMEESEGNKTRAMETLGLSRRTFYRKCEELNIRFVPKNKQ